MEIPRSRFIVLEDGREDKWEYFMKKLKLRSFIVYKDVNVCWTDMRQNLQVTYPTTYLTTNIFYLLSFMGGDSSDQSSAGGLIKGFFDWTGYHIRYDNFALGAAWGVISGYTSKSFFQPIPDRFQILRLLAFTRKFRFLKPLTQAKPLYHTIVAGRVIRRAAMGGFVFDLAESKFAQKFNSGKSSPSTTFVGLFFLAMFFRVSNNIRDAAIASTACLGGYLAGTQLAKFAREKKRGND